jgi:hypothetical protein
MSNTSNLGFRVREPLSFTGESKVESPVKVLSTLVTLKDGVLVYPVLLSAFPTTSIITGVSLFGNIAVASGAGLTGTDYRVGFATTAGGSGSGALLTGGTARAAAAVNTGVFFSSPTGLLSTSTNRFFVLDIVTSTNVAANFKDAGTLQVTITYIEKTLF